MSKIFAALAGTTIFRRRLVASSDTTPFVHDVHHEAASHSWWELPHKKLFRATTRLNTIWLVQSISLFRIFAILLFASLAFSEVPRLLLVCLYVFAMASDLLDGYVARKLDVATYFGKVLDLVADKSLTVIALLYAAERGIDLLPLAVIAMRDVVMIGMRLVTLEGKQLLPTNRVFGGVMASLIGASTLVLVNAQSVGMIKISNILYWVCALVFAINLLMRLHRSAPRIVLVSTGNLLSEAELDSCRKCRCKHE